MRSLAQCLLHESHLKQPKLPNTHNNVVTHVDIIPALGTVNMASAVQFIDRDASLVLNTTGGNQGQIQVRKVTVMG